MLFFEGSDPWSLSGSSEVVWEEHRSGLDVSDRSDGPENCYCQNELF